MAQTLFCQIELQFDVAPKQIELHSSDYAHMKDLGILFPNLIKIIKIGQAARLQWADKRGYCFTGCVVSKKCFFLKIKNFFVHIKKF